MGACHLLSVVVVTLFIIIFVSNIASEVVAYFCSAHNFQRSMSWLEQR